MIRLIKNYPYDNSYDYIKLFKTKTEQAYYFSSFNNILIDEGEEEGYIREGDTFIVEYNYDYLVSNGVNYVIWNNGHKDLYCFITKKEYVDNELTRLYYEVDVLNTFCFDINIKNSYIERKKCTLSEISDFDEGFNIGEHIIEKTMIEVPKEYSYFAMFNGFKNQELIFKDGKLTDILHAPFTSNKPLTTIDGIQYPLHFMELKSEYLEPTFTLIDKGSNGGVNGGNWEEGVCSSTAFRLSKGYEGYAPSEYQDMYGYWTIGYGVTQMAFPNEYAELKSKNPASEQQCAEVSYKIKVNNFGKTILPKVKEYGCTNQNQFDALMLLSYNAGTGRVTGDNELTRAIKSNPTNESVIRPIWENFIAPSQAHKERRKEECDLFFGKEVKPKPITIWANGTIIGTVVENNGDGWLP